MKIMTWNVWNRNRHTDRVAGFAVESDADVIAFQELEPFHLQALTQKLPHHHRTAKDFSENGRLSFLGLFSRQPIRDEKTITLPRKQRFSPSIVGRLMKWQECIDAQAITVETGGILLTIVNIHLTCAASPRVRLEELNIIADHFRNHDHLVICGDFNSYASPLLNAFIGWLYGFGLEDYSVRELSRLHSWAAEHNLQLVKNGVATFAGHTYLGFRFDHFLTRGVTPVSLTVSPKTCGSDHHPVLIEIESAP